MKIRKVALLHDNSLYGKGLAEAIKKLLKDAMISVVFYDALIPGRQDYSDILTKIKGTDPEFFFFSGYYPEAAVYWLISREIRQQKDSIF
jgi:branched-chain amino acid transport system substrate-binding protein